MDMKTVDHLKWRYTELKHAGRLQEALELCVERQRLLDGMSAPAKLRALNLNSLAALAIGAGNLELAESAARDSLAIYQAENAANPQSPPYRPGDNPIEKLATYSGMLAGVLARRGKFEEAEPWAVRSLEYFLSSGIHKEGSDFIVGRQTLLSRIRNRDLELHLDEK